MVFLILFPSFMPKNDAFLIGFKSFSSYSHTPFIYFARFSCMIAVAFPDSRRIDDNSFSYVVY